MQRGRTRGETARRQEGAIRKGVVMQRGRNKGETARLRGGTVMGSCRSWQHGRTSAICFSTKIRHMITPPFPTRPASELSTPNSYSEARADEFSVICKRAKHKEYNGLADGGTFAEV